MSCTHIFFPISHTIMYIRILATPACSVLAGSSQTIKMLNIMKSNCICTEVNHILHNDVNTHAHDLAQVTNVYTQCT